VEREPVRVALHRRASIGRLSEESSGECPLQPTLPIRKPRPARTRRQGREPPQGQTSRETKLDRLKLKKACSFSFSRLRPALIPSCFAGSRPVCRAAEPTFQAIRPPPEDSPPRFEFRPTDPLNQSAIDHYYNLDYDLRFRISSASSRVIRYDPFAVNHLLSAVQVREFYRMGA